MGLGIGLGPGFDYFRQYNVIRRIGIRRTDNNFSYLAVDLTRTAVGLSRLLIRLPGTRYLTN